MIKKIFVSIAFFTIIVSILGCGGSGGGPSSTPKGVNSGIPSIVRLLDVQNVVQTNAYAYFKVRVLDGNGVPVKNHPVTFTNLSPIGELIAVGLPYTDDNGFQTVRVTSSVTGFVTVEAEVNSGAGQIRDRRTVYFTSGGLNLLPFIVLDVDGDNDGVYNEPADFILLQSQNDAEAMIRATLYDGFGLRAAGREMLFGADLPYRVGSNTTCSDLSSICEIVFPDGVRRTTNSDGEAFVRVRIEPQALRSIRTLFNVLADADNNAFNMVTLFLEPVYINSVILAANPVVVQIDETSDITAAVRTNLNLPAPDGTVVSFTTTCGFVEPFGQLADGSTSVQFTAPSTPVTCTVTGTSGGVSGSVTLNVTSVPATLSIVPASQTIANPAIGSTATYSIQGGTAPFTVFSNNPGLVNLTIAGTTLTATVTTVPAADTTVTITVYDALGDTATANLVLDVPAVTAFAVQPPTQTITDPNIGNSVQYTIVGGTPNFSAFSSNAGLVTVAVDQVARTVTATVVAVPSLDTTITITVLDSTGATRQVALVLDVLIPPLVVTPNSASVTGLNNPDGDPSDDVTFFISGGVPDYTMTSDQPLLIPSIGSLGAGVTQFTVDPDDVISQVTVTLTVTDSVGAFQNVTVTVNP